PPQAVLPQPGIATPTTLASHQVNTISYPTPRPSAASPAVKQRVFTGTVTKLHDTFGFVDEEIFFQMTSVKGNQPKVGERVLVEASYNASMPFKWNATRIQLLPGQVGCQATPIKTNIGNINQHTSGSQGKPVPMNARSVQSNTSAWTPSEPKALTMASKVPYSSKQTTIMLTAVNLPGSHRAEPNRFSSMKDREKHADRERDRRDRDRGSRDIRRKRSPPPRSRSPARSPPRKRSSKPRYVCQIPKLSLNLKNANVVMLKSRYSSMYIPSDFFFTNLTWSDAFPLERSFKLGHSCNFHVLHKDVEPLTPNKTVLEPNDADHLFSAKVMLLSSPSLDDLYHKSCGLAEDPVDIQESFQHPTRLLQFLVGIRGKNEPMAIGGPWSPSLDGADPAGNPQVLINTAIRTTKALTGIDLKACTKWYVFAEICYMRPASSNKGRHVDARVETVVIFIPDVWMCSPSQTEWEDLQAAYAKQLKIKIGDPEKTDTGTQALLIYSDSNAEKKEPTHFSELDPKSMKILDLRQELEARNLSAKGLKSQLIARLTKMLKSEQEAEEEELKQEQKTHLFFKKFEILQQEEEQKRKEKKDKALLEKRYVMPDVPSILVHPHPTAKGGKFDCCVMSLSVLLDYRPEDNKEHSFEVSLFAEMFNEMLMRDFGFNIYLSLCKTPAAKKDEDKKEDKKDKEDKKEDKDNDKDDEKEKERHNSEKVIICRLLENDLRAPLLFDNDDNDKHDDKEEDMEEDDDKKVLFNACKHLPYSNTSTFVIVDKKEKKEKKKITVDPGLLLSYVYYDQNHTGYILDKDIEDILMTIGLQLSRAQIKKVVQRVIVRDSFNYRKITDAVEGENIESVLTPVEESKLCQDEEKTSSTTDSQSPADVTSNIIIYKGSMINIDSLLEKLEKSEENRMTMQKKLSTLETDISYTKEKLNDAEHNKQKIFEDLQKTREDLSRVKTSRNTAENQSRKYHNTLHGTKDVLTKAIASITSVLFQEEPK
ncbi:hypothetical protein LOTGIDRAFT_51697, partial [Lottia gigantea]